MQRTRRDAQRLTPRHAVKVRARGEQRTVATSPNIVHNASHLPLHAIQTRRPAPLQLLEQPLDLPGPATAGCQQFQSAPPELRPRVK
jgi:hypothetical protein